MFVTFLVSPQMYVCFLSASFIQAHLLILVIFSARELKPVKCFEVIRIFVPSKEGKKMQKNKERVWGQTSGAILLLV